MTVLGSEMNRVTAEYSSNKNSVEALTAKSNVYTKQLDEQRNKINVLTTALENAKKEYGEDSKQVKEWQIQLNNAEAAMSKTEASLKGVTVELKKQESAFTSMGKNLTDLSKKCKETGQKLTDVGKTMSMAITAPIVAAGAAAVKLASDMSETLNKVDVAFGDSAKSVKDWSETSLKSFGMAKGSALDMAALFGDMGTAMGQSTDEAAAMSTGLVGLAGDLASFKNIGIAQASDALKGIFTGEGESLKSLGVIMLDSTLIAYANANGYKTLYKEMTQAEKVALRYAYVMDATRNSQGDFARTSEGTANQIRILGESVKELGAELGEKLLPIITPVISQLTEWVQKFGELDDGTQKTILTVAGLAAAIGPVIVVSGSLITAVGAVTGALGAASTAIGAAGGALAVLASPIGIVVASIAAVAALGAVFYAVHDSMTNATDAIKEFSKTLADSAKTFNGLIDATESEADLAKQMSAELYALAAKENKSNEEKARMAALVASLNKLMPELNLAIDKQTGMLNQNKQAVSSLITEKKKQIQLAAYEDRLLATYKEQLALSEKITEGEARLTKAREENSKSFVMFKGWEKIAAKAELDEAVEAMAILLADRDTLNSAAAQYESAFDKIAVGMGDSAREIKDTERDLTLSAEETSAILAADLARRQSRFEQHSVDVKATMEQQKKDFEEYNTAYAAAADKHRAEMGSIEDAGIEKSKLTAKEVKANLLQQMKDFQDWRAGIQQLAARVPEETMIELRALGPKYDVVINDLNKMTDKGLAEWVAVWRASGTAASDAALEETAGLPGAMYGIGADAGQGFVDGLNSKISDIKKSSAGAANVASRAMRDALQSKSPSKVMEQIGSFASEGFILGLTGNLDQIKRAASAMSAAAMPNLNGMMSSVMPQSNPSNSPSVSGSVGYSTSNLYMDSVLVASGTSKVQYRKNQAHERAFGVVPA